MCDRCEAQFNEHAAVFETMLASYSMDFDMGKVRGTPGERVHDLAVVFQMFGTTPTGCLTNAWFVAVAMERLMALEKAGLPT
jgi:hypothetical protein